MANSPNHISIDLSALVHNLDQVKTLINAGTRIMGIVKADAYGHGRVQISETLVKNGVHCLGVAYVYEALELRRHGIQKPLVILSGIRSNEEAREVVDNNLTPVVYDLESAESLSNESITQGKKTTVHLKIDTGMGRLGIPYPETLDFLKKLLLLKGLHCEAFISHLSSADEKTKDYTNTQIRRFKQAVDLGRSMGLGLPLNSLANSVGIMGYPNAHFEMVRPGIALYGGLPVSTFSSPVSLRPVMHLKGRVLQVKTFSDRMPIGYGRTYYTKGSSRLAILSIGYADGLPRSLSNNGEVLIHGEKARIVGRVCMNYTAADITGINGVETGDEVVVLGSQKNKTISGDAVAQRAGTISYEVFCSIGRLNRKDYLP